MRGNIEVRFDLSGSSNVTLTGSAQDVTIDASGSSDVDLTDFFVADADVEVSGSSTAIVKPSGRLGADASGASHVYQQFPFWQLRFEHNSAMANPAQI